MKVLVKILAAIAVALTAGAGAAWAQTPEASYPARSDLSKPTWVAPAFFGPNAFQIPDMLDGTVSDKLRLELSGEYFAPSSTTRLTGEGWGAMNGWTAGLNLRATIPLWTDRVNLVIWMPMEWYDDGYYRGFECGDAYVSTDFQVLKERKYCPAISIRAALKSASGGSYNKRRYYDDPGYFFDLAIGKSFYFGGAGEGEPKGFFEDLRLAASAGFLCWQTADGRQNDAVMYGVQAKLTTKYFVLSETFGGYVGWERCGDAPMSLKTQINGRIGAFEPFFLYQYGLCDWPFHQFRLGLVYNLAILNK